MGALNIKSDSVGKDMEAELWRKAKLFIEEIERQGDEDGAGAQLMQENGDRDVSMGNV